MKSVRGLTSPPPVTGVTIIDYGMGNVRSVQNALSRLGCEAQISSQPREIAEARALILPGVGAFGQAMENLKKRDLLEPLHKAVGERSVPLLGICLGMQLFAERSEEMGNHEGLGWIPGEVVALEPGPQKLAVPHVGWNNSHFDIDERPRATLFNRLAEETHFYFDHSFHFRCAASYVISTVDYGGPLVAAVQNKNIFGVQFHPEKSQTAGLKVLRNFLNIVSETSAASASPTSPNGERPPC